jgi:hypothetical protein
MQQAGGVRGAGSLTLHINSETVPRLAIPGKAAGFEYDWMVTLWAGKPSYCFPRLDVWLDGNLRREDLQIPNSVQVNDVANLRKLVLTTEEPIERMHPFVRLGDSLPDPKKYFKMSTMARKGVSFRKWYLKCHEDLAAVKPGMTRREIEKRVHSDGGFSTDTCEHEDYVHPDGHCLKIRIGFEVKYEQNRPIRGKDDLVVTVSAPFLEEFFCD